MTKSGLPEPVTCWPPRVGKVRSVASTAYEVIVAPFAGAAAKATDTDVAPAAVTTRFVA